ncbi:2OG-Fe(II) oxygenase [Maritimibacter sp. DP1N21-5]|uniref:2OG-Fe(II) oxygenase n=1 Tax=Maritimibacter sp. DP1N21-5 TaxID=2836867 RepID=UPI001C464D11|nr:2OG-Fe(II) oxygenase [Maritimibacter sp. DP1N21-5]MBV7409171.1 2OG-Fe(II) oxygenase [Maritimibacter sp. DP1N21-5]
MAEFTTLNPGNPAPYFKARSGSNPRFTFDTAAGRYLVLCFLHDAQHPAAKAAIAAARSRRDLFDDAFASFFGVSTTPGDDARLKESLPGHRYFFDDDLAVSRLYGAASEDGDRRGIWVIVDPTMRVIETVPFGDDGRGHARALGILATQLHPSRFAGFELQAPILVLPRVFEPSLCAHLVGLYDETGGTSSGFMQQVDGKTVHVMNADHKVRSDVTIEDADLIRSIQARIMNRVVPEIAKVHMFHANRMERYIVSCYAAEDGGHFRAHRDNTTSGTAHRRFAVSINLTDDFEGGEVGFPEYGPRTFKAPLGGAVVFSCALLHRVSPVTRGRRYAFLPFLYDDAAAKLREDNLKHLARDDH